MKLKIKYFMQLIAFFTPAFLKILIWKCLGFKVGQRVKIGLFSLIMVDHLDIADDACIDSLTIIVFLKEFKLGEKGRIAYFTKIYGEGSFRAESRNLVSVQCLIECSPHCSVIMKDYSCFGPRNTIYTHGHYLPRLQGYPAKKGDVVIGAYSWTGMATVILPGTTIGEHTIITPGAVLTGNIPGNSFIKSSAYGYDARPVEEKMVRRTPQEIRQYLHNVLAMVVRETDDNAPSAFEQLLAEPDLLFQDLSLPPPEIYKGKNIIIHQDAMPLKTTENVIVAGYGLPEEIRKKRAVPWMDFEDYSAWPASDKILSQVVERLYSKLDIRFLFIKE